MKHIHDIPVVFFVEVESEDSENYNYLQEREKIRKVFAEEFKYVLENFEFIHDAISERVSGIVTSIRVQKP